ncbi:MAG: phosphoribosylformylglycinamidine synthase subunit PurS [Thermomicrobiales bacterium]
MSTEMIEESTATGRSYLAEVFVSLKAAVNDPQGLAIRDGLRSLGYADVEAVRAGKYLRVTLRAASSDDAHAQVTRMCDQLLTNPVIETYQISITVLADH